MITLGIYIWGAVVIALSAIILYGVFISDPTVQNGLYIRIKDCSSVLGPIIAASVLAWSWFFQTAYPKSKDDPKIETPAEAQSKK